MVEGLLDNLVSTIARVGVEQDDLGDTELRSRLLVRNVAMFYVAGVVWGLVYIALGEPVAGAVPLGYCVLSLLCLILFARVRRYRLLYASQLLLVLLLPFLVMMALGGFINSSAVILWSLFAPLGALLFVERRNALRWFVGYILLVVASGFLEPLVRTADQLPITVLNTFFIMNITAVSAIAFILLYYFIGQKDTAMRLLAQEQQRSESLLLNILPQQIADILKVEQRVIADQYDSASIIFADLVGFTPLSATMTPVEMVELLNEIYSYLDDLVEKYGLEKIRTMGDGYMVVSGVPRPRPDHAHAAADMALEACGFLDGFRTRTGQSLQFRMGINSGPLVAGVVGHKKFHYDIWGDAVNVASRMESHGAPGRVHMTAATRELIKDEFDCERRGKVNVKGKGEMETWFLVGRKPES